MFEWDHITHDELNTRFLDFRVVKLLDEYQRQILPLILEYLDRAVTLEKIDLSEGFATIPFAEYINVIERNTRLIMGADTIAGMRPTVTWRGGFYDMRRLSYRDVNRWFHTLQLLYRLILGMIPTEFETGSWECGYHLEYQMIGVL